MKVEQIHTLVNSAMKASLGETATLLTEDLSNVVESGRTFAQLVANNGDLVDHYTKALVNMVGMTIDSFRTYNGKFKFFQRNSWEYGSALRKIRVELMKSTSNPSWDLNDGQSYDQTIFTAPKVHEKFWNDRDTFEIPISIAEIQVRESFRSAEDMARFISMIEGTIANTKALDVENLSRRVLNNFIGETFYNEYGSNSKSASSKHKAINLLYLYNQRFGTSLTVDECLNNKEFCRFMASEMSKTATRMSEYNGTYNIGKTAKHTPRENLRIIIHSDFEADAKTYLYSDTFHEEFVKLPAAEVVSYWQAPGAEFDFDTTSSIDVVTSENHSVSASGIIGVMFDENAIMINCENARTKAFSVERAEFMNYWHKYDANFMNDFDEQFVVFFVA